MNPRIRRSAKGKGVAFIAHRGSSFLAPENTLAALKLGWTEADICEIDVRPTSDGRLAVIHDATTRRTTGRELVVAKTSLRNLQRLDAGWWKGAAWKGERLPSLAEVLAAMPARKQLLIEVKAGPEVVPELAREVHASGKGSRVLIHSFDLAVCLAARKAMPRATVHLLAAINFDPQRRRWLPALKGVIAKARRSGMHGVGINVRSGMTAAKVRQVKAAGLALHVWTVDTIPEARRLVRWKVDAIITNRPGWLREQMDI